MNEDHTEDEHPPTEDAPNDDSSIPGLSTNFSGIDEDEVTGHQGAVESVGPYQIISPIGEGGMGTVYLAEQTSPIKREVALKIIKAVRSTSKQIISRFEAERQAVALMEHPNIAKVFDAGTTSEGSPFFAMELVRGVPFTQYCDEHKLSIRERLELFVPVCRAVQHAHQKGVIHRDLKPSNVLIGVIDGKPIPKVIDFGLAKATKQREQLIENSLQTQFGQIVGTPQYMSPEQASTEHDDIDTRTDVYSLGVMLFELLTGSTPLAAEALKKNHLIKILELIRDSENPRPSTRLGDSSDTISSISSSRKISPNQLQQVLRGELDWIVMKALEKDRDRRYQSSNELAEDINRFLNDEPVEAKPPSASYRVQKFVKKNKGLVASLATVIASLVVAIVVISYFAFIAAKSSEKAEDSAEMYAGVLGVMKNSFAKISPLNGGSPEMKATEVLLFAKESLGDSDLDPKGQIELLNTLNECFIGVGNFSEAIEVGELALEFARKRIPGEVDHFYMMHSLAHAHSLNGNFEIAKRLEHEALVGSVKILGEKHEFPLNCLSGKAVALSNLGCIDDAILLGKRSVRLHEAEFGKNDQRTLSARQNLGDIFMNTKMFGEAEQIFEAVLSARQDVLGEEDIDTLVSQTALASARLQKGDVVESVLVLEKAYAKLKRKLGESHPNAIFTLERETSDQGVIGQVEKSLETLYKRLEQMVNDTAASNPSALSSFEKSSQTILGIAMPSSAIKGSIMNPEIKTQLSEAAEILVSILALQKTKLGGTHPNTLKTIANLTSIYNMLAQYQKIVELLGDSNSLIEGSLPDSVVARLTTRDLAVAYLQLRRFDEALPLFLLTTKRLAGQYGEQSFEFQIMNLNLGRCYEAIGELSEAVKCFEACFEYSKNDRRIPATMVGYLYRTCLAAEEFEKLTNALEYKVAEAKQLEAVAAVVTLGTAADYFEKMQNYTRAEEVLKETLDLCKANDLEVIGTQMMKVGYGWLLVKRGELDEAESWMRDGMDRLKTMSDQVPANIYRQMTLVNDGKWSDLQKAKAASESK